MHSTKSVKLFRFKCGSSFTNVLKNRPSNRGAAPLKLKLKFALLYTLLQNGGQYFVLYININKLSLPHFRLKIILYFAHADEAKSANSCRYIITIKWPGGRGEKMSVTENNFWQDMGGGGGVGEMEGITRYNINFKQYT